MSRILIMEDWPALRADLVDEIQGLVPSARIDEGDRIEDGLELIRDASCRQKPYDAAILDFKLHSDDPVFDQVIDEQLCNEIRRTMHGCLVVHVTAHPEDPVVVLHEERCHRGIRGPRSWKVAKNNDYLAVTARIVRDWVYAKPVHDVLDRLFAPARPHVGMGAQSQIAIASASQMLVQLEHLTALHWGVLDLPTQSRILMHFERIGDRLLLHEHRALRGVA